MTSEAADATSDAAAAADTTTARPLTLAEIVPELHTPPKVKSLKVLAEMMAV